MRVRVFALFACVCAQEATDDFAQDATDALVMAIRKFDNGNGAQAHALRLVEDSLILHDHPEAVFFLNNRYAQTPARRRKIASVQATRYDDRPQDIPFFCWEGKKANSHAKIISIVFTSRRATSIVVIDAFGSADTLLIPKQP